MSVNGFDDSKNRKEVYTKDEIANVEVNITLADGFELVPAAENRCIYNKLTKQCTLYFRVNGGVSITGTATTIFTIPDLYRPTKIVYGNATFGNTVNGQVSVRPNGEVNVLPINFDVQSTAIAFVCGQISWIVDGLVEEEEYTLGDINEDGQVTQSDLDLLNSYLAKEQTLTKQQLQAADVNKDGYIDSGDMFKLKQYIDGIIDSLE